MNMTTVKGKGSVDSGTREPIKASTHEYFSSLPSLDWNFKEIVPGVMWKSLSSVNDWTG